MAPRFRSIIDQAPASDDIVSVADLAEFDFDEEPSRVANQDMHTTLDEGSDRHPNHIFAREANRRKNLRSQGLFDVEALLAHHWSLEEPGRIMLQVQWPGWSGRPKITWEAEDEIQHGASELLFAYWEKQGGRDAVLFPSDHPPYHEARYWVFKILAHKRHKKEFHFRVQWVGYPDGDASTTMEPEFKLKMIANEVLEEYFKEIGGRNQMFATRRRRGVRVNKY
ncbi:hypothetical protein G7054_g15075 [Neopestalotiopsis clavispora]|nr:hypothetical protein G7054_g15075 [Neopestalotiopsis clavispora]